MTGLGRRRPIGRRGTHDRRDGRHDARSASDDWFPFAPMRQFAYAADPDGRSTSHFVEGIGADGSAVVIGFDDIDLRPAELEGLLGPLATREERLLQVLDTFRANRPDERSTVGIRYMRIVVQFDDGHPTDPELIELTSVRDDR